VGDVVIIGGGQAAASCAAKLRALGHGDAITIVASEAALPYQRPPLSKKYVAGELAVERLLIRAADWYAEQKVTVARGTRATAIDPAARKVTLADGQALAYHHLVLATGSRPRLLPGAIGGNLPGLLTMRDLADADRLAPDLKPGKRLLVIGGGYIGLEAAAVAASKGLSVTVIEAAPRILQRVAAEPTSDYFRALHQRHGVEIREGVTLKRLIERDGRVGGAELGDGTMIDADLVLVGIGIVPNDDLARDAGLAVENGILVDGQCRTSDPQIFAAGDCASLVWQNERIRLESVQNAIDQGEHVAKVIMGETADYRPYPWFWSDQYDVKLQIAGLNRNYDSVVLRPGARPGSQSIWYYRAGAMIAVDAMNDALTYSIAKKVLETGRSIPSDQAADASVDLKPWLKTS
jgi:3-phenylpropionate/trans-cinnamate dioxygenase ferredoxin reductase subunit